MLHRPEVVRAGRFPMLEKSCGFIYRSPTVALHQHDYEGHLHIGETRYELRPGDLTLTPAEVDSHYHLPRSGYHLCIHFRHLADVRGTRNTMRSSSRYICAWGWVPMPSASASGGSPICTGAPEHTDPRKRALALAAASAGNAGADAQSRLAGAGANGRRSRSPHAWKKRCCRLIELIDTRLKDVLAVPTLAEESGLSQNYLARVFRRRYGMAVPHFILLRRIELARHLLTTSKATVKQVAHEVGLPDVQHFNKQFRRVAGMSPTAYRGAEGGKRKTEGRETATG